MPVLIREQKLLAMTLKCVELARTKTKLPFQLIIVETESNHLIDYADIHIYEKERFNPAKSHNRGWKIADGEYIALLTNDVYVEDNWLECLLDCFKIKDCGASTLGTTQFLHQKENKIEEGNWWSVMMTTRKIFDEVGYYDERFMESFEDSDLLLRMYIKGYKMYRNFNCIVEHLVGATLHDGVEHDKKYLCGRVLFNKIHKDCKLDLFQKLK